MMSRAKRDSKVAVKAAMVILDGRDPAHDSSILVTLEHTIATVLLGSFDPVTAARMLNEALVQGVEQRLALYASKQGGGP